ncbi:DUF1328 family protein [Halomarina oriensis]|uniref:UPF0391 membrane protein GQS65_02465 n=1 Tax=Halomarina oriensis TaxID=671145 RepID=A0A6B0GML1_9EURY|nr:DUF1328 family protein [Halomarina oriensis]MWG33365.1 DUF1328 domain-containing protein [Halomarina oriensis]
MNTALLSALGSVVAQLGGSGQFLWLAVVFFVVAIVAALLGFRGAAGISMGAARLFVVVFLVLAVLALLL